jgi:hypothetical protein
LKGINERAATIAEEGEVVFRFRLACSFCGRSAAQVEKLVAGKRAYICDRCAEETIRIMNAAGDPQMLQPASLLRWITGWFRSARQSGSDALFASR